MAEKNHKLTPSVPGSSEQITRKVNVETSVFSGPLPTPEVLVDYNRAFPGCAERIVKMAERQSVHRQELERTVIESNIASEKRGSYQAFVLALIVILGGIALIYTGHVGIGATLVISDIVALAGTYLYGKRRQRKELTEKREAEA